MGIQLQDTMHGAALTPLVEHPSFKALNKPDGAPYGVYLLNNNRPFIVKYATSDSDRWSFTFTPEHIYTAQDLAQRFPDEVFIILVCHPLAVCGLKWSEFQQCLNLKARRPQHISCEIPKGSGIRVRGPGKRQLKRVVPRNAFPKCLFD